MRWSSPYHRSSLFHICVNSKKQGSLYHTSKVSSLVVTQLPGMVVFLVSAWLSENLMNVFTMLDSSYIICIFICI